MKWKAHLTSIGCLAMSLMFTVCLLVFLGSNVALAGEKFELVLETGLAQAHEQTWGGTGKPWTEGVTERTGGAVVFKNHFAGELVSMIDLIRGVGSGIIDVASPFIGYYPSEFALEAVLGSLTYPPFTLGEPERMAITRILYAELPAYKEAYRKRNVKKVFTISCPGWSVVSSVPIKTLSDFKGKKIRTFGTFIPKMFRSVGAVPVTVPFSDMPDALHKKIVDGTFINISNARDMNLGEVAPHIVLLGPNGIPPHVMPYSYVINLDTWKKLPAEIKRIMLEEGKRIEMEYAFHSFREQMIAAKQMEKAGATIHVISDADLKEWGSLCGDIEAEAAKVLDEKGLPGSKSLSLIKKYEKMAMPELMMAFYEAWEKEFAMIE